MDFDYASYGDDDHHIDLRNPHFRRDPMHFANYNNADMFSHHAQNSHFAHALAGLAVDVKPRLTKEQHDILESHYQQQNKPNTQTKKGFAEALGVSLDKVNNWFQNRRAKSKQDAKKAAGGVSGSGGQQHQHSLSHHLSNDDLSAEFLSSEYFNNPHNDSAVGMDPVTLSNSLGITQTDSSSQASAQSTSPGTVSPRDMMPPPSHKSMPSTDEVETHRRTLTQEEFDSFAHGGDYIPDQTIIATDKSIHESPVAAENSEDLLNEYFPELNNNFAFDNGIESDVLDSSDMQPAFSADSYGTASSSAFSEAPTTSSTNPIAEPAVRNPSTQSSVSDWSEHSTPALSVTPAGQHADFTYGLSESDISPRGKVMPPSSSMWQPGQSVPVDYHQMEREFREAAMRSASQSDSEGLSSRHSSLQYGEQPTAFPGDHSFSIGENTSLTQSMGNMEITNEQQPPRTLRHQTSMNSMSGAGSIAARRQRPRPQPLSSSSLRSTSYCGPLPTAPGMSNGINSHNLAPSVPTLRRIKSSNVMNGIASGRIQKNIGGQRSPLNFTFAESLNSPKFARRVSSYSPAGAGMNPGSANLAPPTPLSPNEMSGLDLQRQMQQFQQAQQMGRQRSMEGAFEDTSGQMLHSGSGNNMHFSSPPTTPLYGTQFARNRLGVMAENTPPQSAPAAQQCFPNGAFPPAPHMQSTLSQGPHMLQSQGPSYVSVMANEYPQMPNVVMPSQPMHAGQYLEMMAAQQYGGMSGGVPQMSQMSHMMPSSQPMHLSNYGNMQFANPMGPQQITPPHSQFPFVPSSPGVLMSHQLQGQMSHSKSTPAADFFVHEYSPPQDVKQATTPRKTVDSGPRNYTFANHGPEHFEKGKTKDVSSSPGSSTGGSSS